MLCVTVADVLNVIRANAAASFLSQHNKVLNSAPTTTVQPSPREAYHLYKAYLEVGRKCLCAAAAAEAKAAEDAYAEEDVDSRPTPRPVPQSRSPALVPSTSPDAMFANAASYFGAALHSPSAAARMEVKKVELKPKTAAAADDSDSDWEWVGAGGSTFGVSAAQDMTVHIIQKPVPPHLLAATQNGASSSSATATAATAPAPSEQTASVVVQLPAAALPAPAASTAAADTKREREPSPASAAVNEAFDAINKPPVSGSDSGTVLCRLFLFLSRRI